MDAGQSKTVAFKIGHTDTIEQLFEIHNQLSVENVYSQLKEVIDCRQNELSGVKIHTPDEKLNRAFPFYQYANIMGSQWARGRSNGFRDKVQDSECLASVNPNLAWEQTKRILCYQYSTGYCPRNYLDGTINPKSSIDNGVWVSGPCYAVVNEIGNPDIILEEIPFNDGTVATVFEHLRRSYEYLYNYQGLYGLIKIWGGDWHDGMDRAGLEGKGVSILLSIQFIHFNKLFIELAKMLGENKVAEEHLKMNEDIHKKIMKYGYFKPYFCTAINDIGEYIGAPESKGAKMYLNPQSWAVIANILNKNELIDCMEYVDEYLETPYGTRFNYPMYTEYDPYIGHMTTQPQGSLINGAVYLQPLVWRLIADCILDRKDAVQMTLEKLLPWNHKHAVSYGEPYILYNFYHETETGYRAGTPGQSWRTATHSIFVRALINFIFGLKPSVEGLQINPCLPPEWKKCSIEKQFRNCTYYISFYQNSGKNEIIADGKLVEGNLLPYHDGKMLVDVYM